MRRITDPSPTTIKHAIGLLAVLTTSIGIVTYRASPGATQSADADSTAVNHAYRPCPQGHDIDIVVMMDASGSLNSRTSGADTSGHHRRTALQTLRDVLAHNLESSALGDMEDLVPDTSNATDMSETADTADTADTGNSDEPLIRAALYYFDDAATRVADFFPISSTHPSDDNIEEALQLGRMGNTNYDAALEAAIAAFTEADNGADTANGTAGAAREEKCRVLLFFTDGIYDPDGRVGKRSLTETTTTELANQLRRNVCPRNRDNSDGSDSETAATISERFRELGVQTYAVLLSDSFLSVLTDTSDGNAMNRSVAAASLQALRGLTSDPGSQFDEHVADHPDCPVDPNRQHGKIISILGLTDLEIALIEAVETASESSMLSWQGCISTDSEPGVRSSEALPDGRFIDAIALYPVGGRISEYRLRGTDASEWEKLEGQSRLLLEGEKRLRHLRSGWNLDVKLDPNPGGSSDDIALRCYATPAKMSLNPVEAEVRTTAGDEPAEVLYMRNETDADTPVFGENYELVIRQADGGNTEVCTAGFEWAEIDDPLSGERVSLTPSECTVSGGLLRMQAYQPVCGESFDAGMDLNGLVKPEHTENIFPISLNAEQFALPVITSHDARVNCPGAPRLSDCSTQLKITNIQAEVPREPLRGEAWCALRLPDEGRVSISGVWQPDAPSDLAGPLEWKIAEARIGDTAPLTADTPLMKTERAGGSTAVAELTADGAKVIVYAEFAELIGSGSAASTENVGTANNAGTADNAEDLPVHLIFATEGELANTGWDIEGRLKLLPVWDWDPGNPLSAEVSPPLRGHYLSVDAAFQSRSNSLWTWIITITMLVSSLLISYLLLCWVLTRNLTLPDARGFWAHRVPLHVSRGLNGRLSLTTDPVGVPLGAQGLLRGKAKRGGNCMELSTRSSTGEQLRISLRRAAFLNLPGLLRGGWAELHAPSKFVGANRKGPRSSTAQLDFTQLTIVELQPSSVNETVRGAAWFLEPKKGPHSGREHAPTNEVRQVIDSLARDITDDTSDNDYSESVDDHSAARDGTGRQDHADQRDNGTDDSHADHAGRYSDPASGHASGRSTITGPPPPPGRRGQHPTTGPPPPPGQRGRHPTTGPPTPPGQRQQHPTTGPPTPPGQRRQHPTTGPPTPPGQR